MQLDQVPIQFVPGELPSTAPLAPPPPPTPPPTLLQAMPMGAWVGIGALLVLLWAMNPRR